MDPRLWLERCYELWSVRPSFRFSVRKFSWDWFISFFCNSTSCKRPPCVVVSVREGFFCLKNGKNGPKIGLFGFIEKFSHCFFLNLVYKESSYYLLYTCANPILGRNLVPEIWAKMLSANQIAGFLNWQYLNLLKNDLFKKRRLVRLIRKIS